MVHLLCEEMGLGHRPATPGYLGAVSTLLATLPSDPRYVGLQDFHAPLVPEWAREVLARWLSPGSPAGWGPSRDRERRSSPTPSPIRASERFAGRWGLH